MRSHHQISFTVALTGISKAILLRDRVLKSVGFARRIDTSDTAASHHTLSSGKNLIDAVFVEPSSGPALAAVLICHGIGETVQRWFPVQQLLAANGVASLVFDYSGYGRSTGSINWTQCDLDAVTAFNYLQELTPHLPISILGFSLGSGPAAAIAHRVPAHLLVLCAAFTSFRAAVCATGLPSRLSFLAPPIWSARDSLRSCTLPVLVVHGQKDRLFPVQMARDLVACCPGPAELLVVCNLAHNQPFRKPHLSYWGLIISRIIPKFPANSSKT
jgi:alpha-beta hydrolase superfamily lysophospholipase